MKALAAAAALLVLAAALPAAAQSYGHRSQTWSSQGSYDFNGQADRPGDYRCDAYWDRGRDDCGAAWRDQRPYTRQYSSGYGHRRYGTGNYAYQPYNQGTRYYGAYGRPDQVYPGGGYGGQSSAAHVGEHYHQSGRSAWCASRYRSYDPVSGYYRAYSGRLVFCG